MQLEELPLPEYKQKFKNDGYFVVRGLLSSEEIGNLAVFSNTTRKYQETTYGIDQIMAR